MFQGLRTVIYAVTDLEKAKDWYSKVLSQEPYFSECPPNARGGGR